MPKIVAMGYSPHCSLSLIISTCLLRIDVPPPHSRMTTPCPATCDRPLNTSTCSHSQVLTRCLHISQASRPKAASCGLRHFCFDSIPICMADLSQQSDMYKAKSFAAIRSIPSHECYTKNSQPTWHHYNGDYDCDALRHQVYGNAMRSCSMFSL